MVFYPNAKVNLGLHVTGKLPDGYHSIETVMYPIPLHDILEVSILQDVPDGELKLTLSGLHVPGDAAQNLISKAHGLITQDYSLPALHVHLHKQIPMGAGIGGGSADAAFFIESLNQLTEIHLSWGEMHHYAKKTGSDCPFFLMHRPCLASGTGTDLDPAEVSLAGKKMLLIHPGIHLSTAAMYGKVTPAPPAHPLNEAIKEDPARWKDLLVNDFEPIAFSLHPELKRIKQQLYDLGAIYAAMSGSGSSMFGIFAQMPDNERIPFPFSYHKLDLE